MFSGCAGLTSAFMAAGWAVGPPIDILYCPEFDLLNPLFLGFCLGLIFERRIRLLHVGPPCSSFSMACNGCLSTMMRSPNFCGTMQSLMMRRRELLLRSLICPLIFSRSIRKSCKRNAS